MLSTSTKFCIKYVLGSKDYSNNIKQTRTYENNEYYFVSLFREDHSYIIDHSKLIVQI